MRPPAPAGTAPSSLRSSRRTASTASRRPSSGSPVGTRPTRIRWSGTTSPVLGVSRRDSARRWRTDMGRFVFKLPDVGEGVAEAEVVGWHVAVGATVAEDDPLVDVMTDKVTVEIPSPRAGRVLAITGAPGDKIRVGAELLVLEVDSDGGAASEEKASSRGPAVPP